MLEARKSVRAIVNEGFAIGRLVQEAVFELRETGVRAILRVRCFWVCRGAFLFLGASLELGYIMLLYIDDNEAMSGLYSGGLAALHIDMSLCKYRK